jgi:hypothetical protein
LVGEWQRVEDAYVRRTTLPATASLDDIYGEMAEPRPYALVHEFVRRLRAGVRLDELATPEAIAQARALNLDDPELRFRSLEETPDGARWGSIEGDQSFVAQVQAGRVTQVAVAGR